ncbi:uncharacterized protein LY89DRAFT_719115 [Mollisia scopiformis]|uniref:Uncharacterized protein n=1 Tax=Mollisia scopiformis TaxID=149040 RepID=A0A194X9C7_MOLSC|nr:uncharacterized protein LY89DRAFT_719115 [Mollisia scopiformis]KUJ16387.1 hypothetical protein LY89DRAFT_719115 [Mollisia scopiformis]
MRSATVLDRFEFRTAVLSTNEAIAQARSTRRLCGCEGPHRTAHETFWECRICSHTSCQKHPLNTELRGIRQSYLSTAAPPRRTVTSSKDKQWKYLTDRQRDQIDAETKQLLRDLNARIRMLSDAELVRQNTEQTIRKKKYARLGLGSLGKWAAGGIGQSKTLEEQLDEAKANAISMHRENVPDDNSTLGVVSRTRSGRLAFPQIKYKTIVERDDAQEYESAKKACEEVINALVIRTMVEGCPVCKKYPRYRPFTDARRRENRDLNNIKPF